MLKVMIVDDESLARQSIRTLVAQDRDINEILEASDGMQALAMFESKRPDILFLDIQMPGLNGIQLAEKLAHRCVVIFVTAYNQYAIAAFELNVVDYLLKPFDDERFFHSLQRAKERVRENSFGDAQQVQRLFKHMLAEPDRGFKSRLIVKDPGRIRLLDVEDIVFIVGAGNYAEVHLKDGKSILHRETMGTLEKQLDPEVFVRIHRSSIVRKSNICELKSTDKGDYKVILKCGHELTLSRRNKHKLDSLLE
ncbi:LytTR family DNA-binding domain-containing protein [Bowmanella sp. Y26]|uniref:LytR/AlgR family response regulator transcription factor n=1 Tax=Bowmanella yangjiangensis TaxID=2811230 RepID=UPI001BDC2436|nr:LytTR family DNA-binding domain-containing protein [Bowmanella yangjiangensis]MBT1064723.1 LytTR family DNA-binding domain-containing protein [Bowmanella yangjiangensis]